MTNAFRNFALAGLAVAFAISVPALLQARDITTLDGKTYKNVSITPKPNGLQLIHSTGVAFISFKRLPENIRKEFGYDPAQASAYEEKLKKAKARRAKALAEKRAKEAETKKRKDAAKAARDKRTAARLTAIRQDILLNGDLYYLTTNKLYDTNGAKMVFEFAKKGDLCAGNGQFMILKNRIYMINGNAVPVSAILKSLANEKERLEEDIARIAETMDSGRKQIDANHQRIADILATANIAVVDYYDAQGRFIGYKYIQNVLADIQIEAVRRLDNENRAIYREMRKLSSIMDDEKKQMAQIAGEHARLDARLDVFNRNRENYRKQHSPPKRSPETTAEKPKPSTATPSTQEDENLERKLLKLKEMFDKGLIPEKLYETKVAAALDNYLGLKRGDDADEKP
jgi:hypothetical protein